MNVLQLKKMLDKYPEDMDIIICEHSDFWIISENIFSVMKGVYHKGLDTVMSSHPSMSEENKLNEKEYLCIL